MAADIKSFQGVKFLYGWVQNKEDLNSDFAILTAKTSLVRHTRVKST